jgi:acetyl esterase/lipase
MKPVLLLAGLAVVPAMYAADPSMVVKRDLSYASAHERQVLDVYAPPHAKNLPVVFWIHGGGWQTGDKSGVQQKPRAFISRGFVFVSTNYRLLPHVDMGTIIRDVAKSLGWVHKNIAVHGGDPRRIFVMGHSAGAQLAALICTDDRLLKAEGVPFSVLKGCVPVDGDTYDVPAIVANGEMRRRLHGQPEPKFGHRAKFGTEDQHREYSAVTHVVRGKGIPPFLLLHITENPDTRAQAQRLAAVLKDAGISVQVVVARDTTHNQVNANLGTPGDPTTVALFDFVDTALKMLAPGS